MAEVHALRAQLQQEAAQREALTVTVAEQSAQLAQLAEQHRWMSEEMRRVGLMQPRP